MEILLKCQLFSGMDLSEIEAMIMNLKGSTKEYEKNEFVFLTGQRTEVFGIVLSGSVHMIKEDFWGGRSIVGASRRGDLFGETYACTKDPLEVSVITSKKTEILFLNIDRVITLKNQASGNLFRVFASKNLMLTRKMEYMAQKTTREKVLSYLWAESQKRHTLEFDIAFDRQQLADYLSVDRSALSATLSKLQKDHILSFRKNHFILSKQKRNES